MSCASPSNMVRPANSNTKTAAMHKAEKFLQLSKHSDAQTATSYKLQAMEQLIAADEIDQAEYSINEDLIDAKLDSTNAAYKQILLARIDLAKQNLSEAMQHLRAIASPARLSEDLLVKFYNTRAEIYRRAGKSVDAVQERIYLTKHLHTPEEHSENNAAIWDTLVQLTPNTLQALPRNNEKNQLNGWLEFATISKQYDASSEQLLAALNNWHAAYPHHPANRFMPTVTPNANVQTNFTMAERTQQVIRTPKKIALMLPLQGAHGKSAQAIRDGFLSAFYAQKDSPTKPKIQVYDTTKQNLQNLYQEIVAQGADFIVGPLTKDEVDAISSSTKSEVPMLALNSSTRTSSQDNILQFSLSPEIEAQAVARKAWHDGHRNAVIIAPKSAWGKRMQGAFEKAWLEQGGSIIGTQEIGSQSDLTSGVKKLLAIDASEARAAKLKQSGFKFAFDPRRRQDIDMIFIATNAALARQVKPLLNFYFAGNVPAYASSSIYTGKAQPGLDQDLNGVQFCDMPWVLDGSIALREHYKPLDEQHNDFDQYARLYALGMDAYKVALQIEQLTMMPHLGISGMTGMLTLEKQQYIDRKLMWASFKKGLPQVSGEQF
ncbi:MAG TPA: penicillin-binding protein activator [Gammaproteobacteria bacterium]|nr:penicillin-binding protein activator [Gammaproteobacteria bacterium]